MQELKNHVKETIELLEKSYDDRKEFIKQTFKIRDCVKFIFRSEYENGKFSELKRVIKKLLELVSKNSDEEKYKYYYCIFQEAETCLVKKGRNLVRIFEDEKEIIEGLKKYYYSKRITTAIFWVVENKWVIFKPVWLLNDKEDNRRHRIDCPFSHYEWWKRYEKEYPNSDFATYPRGRIMYDLRRKEHVVFYDECISKTQIEDILDLLQVEKYVIEYDEHYNCDKCVRKKDLFK